MKKNKLPQNNNEINNYQKRGFIKNLPFGVKATFIKYWFYGAIHFFFFFSLSFTVLSNIDFIIICGCAGGVLFDIAVYNIFLLFADSREEASNWWFFKSKKLYSMFTNIAVMIGIFFAYYYIVTPIRHAIDTKIGRSTWLFAEPLSSAIILISLDTAICWTKNLIIKLFKHLFNKTDEDIKQKESFINILDVTPVSVTFELNNKSSYLSNKPYNILLDNEIIFKKVNTNVYTIFDLKPDTKYKLSINKINKEFITPKISKFYKCFEGNDIQSVIDNADQYSLIIINKGTYKVDTLKLKNNLTVYFRKGAVLKPINNKLKSIIHISDIKDTKIISEGVIDAESTTDIVSIYNSSNFSLIGAGLNNAKDLGVFVFHSFKINLLNLNISSKSNGIKLDRSSNINIIGTQFLNNKEALSINFNTSKDDDYVYSYKDFELRNLNINNCNESIIINSEHHSKVSNIDIKCSTFSHVNNGLIINSSNEKVESIIKDVYVSYINMEDVLTSFIINITNKRKTIRKNLPIEEINKIPYFDNIVFKNIKVKDYQLCASYVNGLEERYIGTVGISESSFDSKKDSKEGTINSKKYHKNGFIVSNVKTFALKHVELTEVIGRKIDANNVSEVIDEQ